ncbi:MAG: immunoglobulin-like domain-containing protein [Nocardioides sp.]|uniref:OmpL47-type beta-barrel domain-containing protein n=1 Tax=Nocardioides sp. TaxID=35761 RepID=UPI003263F4AF
MIRTSMIRSRLHAAARTWTVGAILLAASMGGVVAGVGPSSAADAGPAQEAVEAVALVHADDVRGNLTLPATGLNGATLTWSSGNPSVVSDTGEVSRPAYGEAPVDVPLTVTGTVDSSTASATLMARVQALPEPADYEAYAFAYFAGESTDAGEQIYFGASRGNDPLDYDVLNGGRPVLPSTFGTLGLRDPFIIRSAEGDRFYLLATDLKAYPAVDFGEAQETGSKYVEVWESTDLVNWSDQRHIKVSSDFAGNTWAPEAFYDEEAGEYVVYWASALYPTSDETGRDINTSYQRMMYATTRDFVTFSEPQPWIDVKRGTGRGMIDATVVKDGDTYYRMVKDEASMTPRQERSTDLRATVTGSLATPTSTPGWQLVKEQVGVGQPNPWGGTFTQGEGPTVFPDNEVENRWYMFIDQPSYHGGQGYLAFRTDDISSGEWTSVPEADLPSSPRHGTVIPVTQAELDAMRAAYQPDLLISSVDDATATTRQGSAPVLPATLSATVGGASSRVAVTWDAIDPASYAAPGTFEVRGTVVRGAADHPVATVTVTDPADPVVVLGTGEPDGVDGWWTTAPVRVTASASDSSGIASVDMAIDGAPWSSSAGASAAALVEVDGTHTVTARALDTTGNRSSVVAAEVRLDATAPVSRAEQDAARRVSVRAADATSGVLRVETRTGSGTWSTYAGPIQVGDAATTVAYRAVDRAGNVEATNTVTLPAVGTQLSASSVAAGVPETAARFGSTVPLTVRVVGPGNAPTGAVRIVSGDRLVASGELVDGRVRLGVAAGDLGVGTHTLQVSYAGSGTHRASVTSVSLRVVAAHSRTRVRLASGDRARPVAKVRVTTDPAGQAPDRVRAVLLHDGKIVRSHWLDLSAAGRARWELSPRLHGRYGVRVVTAATDTLTRSADTDRARLRERALRRTRGAGRAAHFRPHWWGGSAPSEPLVVPDPRTI